MAILYVDECGEEGFNDSSSKWLILGGALQPTDETRERMIDCYDTFKSTHFADNWHFHFNRRTHDERIGFTRCMANCGLSAQAVAIYKPHIQKRENFQQKYYLYFYALRFLLEKATIWCRDNHPNEKLYVILSGRRGLKIENVSEYLSRVNKSSVVTKDNMQWEYLDHTSCFDIEENKKLRGLQVADCVASSLGKAIEVSKFGTLEPRYMQEMYPMFNKGLSAYNSAIKIWPSIPTELYNESYKSVIEFKPKAKV